MQRQDDSNLSRKVADIHNSHSPESLNDKFYGEDVQGDKSSNCQPAVNSQSTSLRTVLGIPVTVWQIGFMMCLMNLSFVIAYSFSGLYVKNILGATALSIGLLEGACETVSYLMKLCSGVISDWLKKRKAVMMFGYGFSVISKITLGLSSTFGLVFTSKIFERFGNGVQASPRDAIVADVAPSGHIGASYGLKRSLAHTGSVLGGFAGILTMKLTGGNFQHVFLIASIPAVIAFIILVFFLKEPKINKSTNKQNPVNKEQAIPAINAQIASPNKPEVKFSLKNLKCLGTAFWSIMLVNAVFMVSRMNEQWLILNYNESFVHDVYLAPTVMIVMNAGVVLSSYPCGRIGDKINRSNLLFAAIVFMLFADLIMYFASTTFAMYCGIVFWGIQLGVSQNVFYSLIAENVIPALRGTAFGIYWFINAIAAFFADYISGAVAHLVNYRSVFLSSGSAALLTIFILILLISKGHIKYKS